MRYWLTPPDDPQCDAKVADIGTLYAQAPPRTAQGERILSTDELTGVQALERVAPGLPLAPGKVERRAFDDVRHGTRCFSIKRAVASGQVVAPTCGPMRTAADFLAHLQRTVASDPDASRWHCIVDNWNTPCAASLVRCVAAAAGLSGDRGVKGKSGILRNRQSRAAFLSDPAHTIVCHNTPKHCSWLNQVEIWLGILGRKLLRRGSFTSVADRENQVLAFVRYDNRTMATPFKWTYQGKALVA